MSEIENFLSPQEEQAIIAAIQEAEKNTSGEIRIHLEKTAKIDVFDRALEVFHMLKMTNTKHQNGVLIYVAVADRNFVIFGDKGINEVVGPDFWDSTRNAIQSAFKEGRFKDGLVAGVLQAGMALKQHFPWEQQDTNELPNSISKG
ncbi:TPM domain-containing protein [Bizionia sediminis]|uniref:TPM domain-containing protein n=1 Tax=Bizionia sediminis TaxID=1737064 RepID=A0ABW5KUB5_9FLAO